MASVCAGSSVWRKRKRGARPLGCEFMMLWIGGAKTRDASATITFIYVNGDELKQKVARKSAFTLRQVRDNLNADWDVQSRIDMPSDPEKDEY